MKKLAILPIVFCALLLAAVEPPNSREVSFALKAIELLRNRMRNPDSLVIEHVYARKTGKPLLCIPYRAHNAFGGFTNDIAEYKGGDSISTSGLESIGWCAGIERNWNRAVKKGWVDISQDYFRAVTEKHQ